ncbi:MAG: glycosyl hydrolase family 18 protein [Pedobacter sp.]|uniref:glycosyl hydrolase family 18 protein n=1 Tax=Pedobacter sp. TaxID=1411316 RepID=UPI002807E2A2|nr:glycosyl hydrolase family 18 protein [Pedobacter sp.]MDQ8003562.1 glycosyl hydrolase family 18 protein [Pedobacter sp.]
MKFPQYLLFMLLLCLIACKKQKKDEVSPPREEVAEETFVPKKQNFKVVGYIWSRANILDELVKVDFDKITHLNIAFINPNPTEATFADMPALHTVVRTAHQKGVYVMLSCGGGSPQRYYTELLRTKRATLVKNFIDFVDKYKLDGIDVDLEGDDIDANYEAFITELKAPLVERNKLLTAAVAWWTRARVTDRALHAFNFINIMAYDATGPWDLTNPGQHSPLSYAVQHLNYWHGQRGLVKEKLVLGVPFYGYGFGTAFTNNASLRQMSWQTVQQNYSDWVDADAIPFPNNGGTFYYNGKKTIKEKTELAVKDAGGIMIWHLLYDSDNQNSLLTLIDKTHKEATK